MNSDQTEIRIRGKTFSVPTAQIQRRTVIATGKWLRMVAVQDEELIEGETVTNPEAFVSQIKNSGLNADIFTFAQKLPDTHPKYNYHLEWDNLAIIRLDDPKDWWEKRLPQETRKNVRRSAKKGVVTRISEFNDDLVRGIMGVYADSPIRQGRRFWHYGKNFETVKREAGTYLDRSTFFGAYVKEELVGFIKVVDVGNVAVIIHIVSMSAHYDKRPTNALIAKVVEHYSQKGLSYLTYGKYSYGNKKRTTLVEFKRRNGFEEVPIPRYYLPLTVWGKVGTSLRLYREPVEILPSWVITPLWKLRSAWYSFRAT